MLTPSEIIELYDGLRLHDANEADTRLKVINSVLFDVLGWTHADVQTEYRVSEDGSITWADYLLTTGMAAIVVEAKSAGAAFDEVPNVRRIRLRGRFLTGETGAAIIQARDYSRKLSVPFAIVTNGNSWIIFPGNRIDGVPFSESSAIVFHSLRSALRDDYGEFSDLLSRSAVISGSLEAELIGRRENQIEDRRLNRFFTTAFSKVSKHSLFPLIEGAVVTAFAENIVAAEPDILEKVYVKTPERIRYDRRIRMHIGRRESVVARAPHRPSKDPQGRHVSEIISTAAKKARPIAVLVLGQVGSGKTTFLDYTRKVASRGLFEAEGSGPRPAWIYVEFRSFSQGDNPTAHLMGAMKAHIGADSFLSDYNRCIKHAYSDEISALMRGPLFLVADNEEEKNKRITELLMQDYSSTQPYVEKILGYAAKNAAVFLVVDNVDQIEDSDLQASVFADAMAVAFRLHVNLICAIREETYVRHRNTPAFDAFDFDAIVIDPPDIQAVLSRRFFLAHQLLQGVPAKFTAENGAEVSISSLSAVIELVQASVLGTAIGGLIEVLATSDVRLALRMTREFLRSGWTASGKALRIYQSTGRYVMPQHEALRAIMLGSQQVYSEELSEIGNPFDSRLAKTEAQLLRLYVLAAAVQFSSERSFRYIEGDEIRSSLREIGFGDEIAGRVLRDLCIKRFMHTTSHEVASLEANFIVSRLGGYVVRDLVANMMFLENVMMDTFIADNSVWNVLKTLTSDIYAERNIVRRVGRRRARAAAFYNHMKDLYTPLRDESIRRGLTREWCTHPLESLSPHFHQGLDRVARSAERNYGESSAGDKGEDVFIGDGRDK